MNRNQVWGKGLDDGGTPWPLGRMSGGLCQKTGMATVLARERTRLKLYKEGDGDFRR